MKKQTASQVYIALILLLCLIPSVGMLLFGESGATANEVLAPAPRWRTAEGGFNPAVLTETADYLADRFAFRQELVTAWSWLNARLLHSSANEQVLLGREDWLFYGDTLADYAGESLTDGELEAIARNLAALQREVESRGADFLFTVAPNKNSLYGAYMPAAIPEDHENANLRRLVPYLERYGVHYADLAPALTAQPPLYYRTDTHWTAEGAAIGADTLLAALGRESAYAAGPFRQEGLHRGDLYEMLYPALPGGEAETVYGGVLSYRCLNDPKGGEAITLRTESENGAGRLLCWRDSFGIALYPYLADAFETAVFSRASVYDPGRFADDAYDTVILEIVERNLPRLADPDAFILD